MKASLNLSTALGALVVAASVQFGTAGTAQAQFIELDYCNPVWVRDLKLEQPVIARDSKLVVRHRGSAPCPAAAAEMSSDFLFLFEFDSSMVRPEDFSSVAAAAAAAQQMGATQVQVVGFTDTSGSPRYNQALSERRAASVANALVSQGVSPAVITTEGRGETELAVPTADGVRLLENRRAEVTLVK